MFRRLKAWLPRELGKWCGYALILLAPGSLIVIPLLWLARLLRVQVPRQGRRP